LLANVYRSTSERVIAVNSIKGLDQFRKLGFQRLLTFVLGITLLLITSVGAAAQQPGSADVALSKTGDDFGVRGGLLTYTITASNSGPDASNNVRVFDAIPAHTTFVSASVSQGTFDFEAGVVTANFGVIDFEASASLTLVVSINQDTPRGTIITNSASETSSTTDPDLSNNTASAQSTVTGAFPGDLVISEFRQSGPGTSPAGIVGERLDSPSGETSGASDEFIEIYNNTSFDHVVSGAGKGYGIVASDGVLRCTIPNGTVIPRAGHFLCANSAGYTLSSYPAGNFSGAIPDATYSLDIPDNAGIALFNNDSGDYSLTTRLDAVGSTAESNSLYREGAGYPTLGAGGGLEYSFYRDNCGRQGVVSSTEQCTITTGVIDTDDNAHDFIFVDTNGTSTAAGQRLGAPGPENLSGPVESNAMYPVAVLDPCVAQSAPPNRVRDFTPDPVNNSSFGTIDVRRTVTNNGTNPATRLRFRVTQQTTFPNQPGKADLRLRSSQDVVVTVDRAPCGSGTSNVTVHGSVLEVPPFQPNGGAFNSSVSVITPAIQSAPEGEVQLNTPLNPGESLDVHFLFGIQATGSFRVSVNVEVVETPTPEEKPIQRKPPRPRSKN
jgi:uncharacterized repeat protein (TIGR01451 family)